jgi:hypothetical protein
MVPDGHGGWLVAGPDVSLAVAGPDVSLAVDGPDGYLVINSSQDLGFDSGP